MVKNKQNIADGNLDKLDIWDARNLNILNIMKWLRIDFEYPWIRCTSIVIYQSDCQKHF